MTEKLLIEIINDKYLINKQLWGLTPVDPKYVELIVDFGKYIYNQGLIDSSDNVIAYRTLEDEIKVDKNSILNLKIN